MNEIFSNFATAVAKQAGRPMVFAVACMLLIVWAAWGPFAGFSENWQLVVNTATTIVTFLMVFLIQNTQNRDGMALQIKLDELIRAIDSARDDFIDLEELSEKQLDALREKLGHLGQRARSHGIAEIDDATGHVERAASELHATVGRARSALVRRREEWQKRS
jgi:low affinity Fe/Cu permease